MLPGPQAAGEASERGVGKKLFFYFDSGIGGGQAGGWQAVVGRFVHGGGPSDELQLNL